MKNYYDLTIYRDLVERFSVRNLDFLKLLIKYLLTNISNLFSANAFYRSLEKSLKSARETFLEYLSYLEEIELIFFVPLFSYSLKVQQVNPKKIYAIDNGLRNAVSFIFSQDYGRLLENLVFVELKRRGNEVYYYKGKRECDFLIKEGSKISQAIQVVENLNKENMEREIEGLAEAMEKFNLNQGLILTKDDEREIKVKLKKKIVKIKTVPIWKWLLNS